MPILHKCQRCGKSLPVGTKCECEFKKSNKRLIYKPPDAASTKSDSFYHSDDWRRLRIVVMSFCDNMDIYSWYKYGKLEEGFIVHHIIPLKDDYNKRSDIDNLIYLTEENHRAIHSIMAESEAKKAEIQKELFDMIEWWKNDIVM